MDDFDTAIKEAQLVWAENIARTILDEVPSEQELRNLGRVPFTEGARWAKEWWFNNGNDEWHKTALEEINIRLREENQRLREALKYIARHETTARLLTGIILDECVTVAKQALAETEEK